MNDKYVQSLIDTVVAQRNEALNSVASLQAQLKLVSEELEILKSKDKEESLITDDSE
jgi:hypothetical protein